ncbi:MAG: type V CRISPR-associated protein Cas12a/Cpf1 [bacterium]
MHLTSKFSQFTKQYSLSKTLRFELKPLGNTSAMLEEAQVLQKDQLIQEKYKKTKPFFDQLHREFVKEALQETEIEGIEEYSQILEEWKKDKKNKEITKQYQEATKKLRAEVVKLFQKKAAQWSELTYPHLKFKNNTIELLSEENIFSLLKERYGNEDNSTLVDETTGEIISIFDSWKGFTGYFGKFFETRKNFYKDDGTASAIATRIIDQNLKRFCDNIQTFESSKEKIDFSEVEQYFEKPLSEVFSIQFYNTCFLQEGIDFYNTILGGKTLENGEKKKGLNELINLHKQKTGEKLPFLKALDKQILSEKEKFIDEIENDDALIEILKTFLTSAETKTQIIKKLFEDFINNQQKYDLSQTYLSKEALNTIAHKWTEETGTFEENLFIVLKDAKILSSSAKKKDDGYSFPDFIPLCFVKEALEKITNEKFWKERYLVTQEIAKSKGFLDATTKENSWWQFLSIFSFEFTTLFEREVTDTETGKKTKIGYNVSKEALERLLTDFKLDQSAKIIIKDFADSLLTIYQMAKYFSLEKKRAWNDQYDTADFYENPDYGYKKFYENAYEEIVQPYNKLRNYLTKKPYNEEKWKLNFDNPTLADGWDKNKESANLAVILRKDGKYFLALMKKGNNQLFDDRNAENFSKNIGQGKYEKIVYKFFPDQAKMFPKVCFSTKGLEFFQPSEEIWNIYKNSEFKKGETFSLKNMHKLIDFYKDCLKQYEGWKCYDFTHVKPTEKYHENIGEFYKDVAEDGYKVSFQDISESYINEKNNNGALYLFQIKNKDWNLDKAKDGKKKTTAKNLHTLYFESLFSAENSAENFPVKLNGQAEIFYRPKTETEKLGTKQDNQGKEVINHKRYNENKIFFHVPLTLNRTAPDPIQFNSKINNFLANNPDINIIGIDRGEKHLAYATVISQSGKILDSLSLNQLNGVNYAEKLNEKAKNREKARQDWQDVEGIKNLKKGYISWVVRTLADLAIKHNAIIIFEDLNMRFKQIRGGIEKSIYQQLEKALIEKLNYLVEKGETDPEKAGSLFKAYQLTAPFTTFKDMGKQTGIIFYTQAAYTSRIDPLTGWRPQLHMKYSNAEKAKEAILNFSQIAYTENYFSFTYNLKKCKDMKEYPQKSQWTICSCVERFRWNKTLNNNKGGYEHFPTSGKGSINEKLQEILTKAGISYTNGNILEQINNLDTKGNETFFRDLIFFFNLICQIRNTNDKDTTPDHQDFILSPVAPFFDSRNTTAFGENLPQNGDENGAFNIARKGIMLLHRISAHANNKGSCEKLQWDELFISNTDWDNFATK